MKKRKLTKKELNFIKNNVEFRCYEQGDILFAEFTVHLGVFDDATKNMMKLYNKPVKCLSIKQAIALLKRLAIDEQNKMLVNFSNGSNGIVEIK